MLVTGPWRHDQPAVVYAKLDGVRQRIAGAPMRVVTGDGRGAQATAANWARDAGVPCAVHRTDWDGAKAQYHADAARADNYLAEKNAIDEQYPPDADHTVPDPDDPGDGAARDPRQEALDELETAVEWHQKGLKAYRDQAVAVRDEDMLNESKPHLVVSFDKPGDRGAGCAEGRLTGRALEKMRKFTDLIRRMRENADGADIGRVVEGVISRTGYLGKLRDENT
ncbi:MAG: SLOG family protein, partial [Acidobacteria bacterium]|nr:SLOG family protein [Acidobacteriota bacterium]